ncbi:MAG TPA: DUF1957 domain-containing protein [Candidatus Paceibacterota bacterium]|nr:DUF1957 domain-containing protein [Candidatus Paceibacterota bacterium]
MPGYLALILHAHLPFVRHPEHERFLEESWLYEAITETYLPLADLIERWREDRLNARLTLTLTPTLCSMLGDPLLQSRYERRLSALIELAEKEVHRTCWDAGCRRLAEAYVDRFTRLRARWHACDRNLLGVFRALQDQNRIEIVTSAATHAVLPLLRDQPAAMRGQILTARDHYRACFGRDAVGFWLPECAYAPGVEEFLREANLRWFVVDTHGLTNATPRPRYGTYAPVFTPEGLAVFGRDIESARQVWSRNEGYPGDPRYRDFYRDIGFDLDFDYVRPYLPSPDHRGFTGIKYQSITGGKGGKRCYNPADAQRAVTAQAAHFLEARERQLARLAEVMDQPPILMAPYDAELFGHWWHEGLAFLDAVVRGASDRALDFTFVTPTDYLRRHATHQVARPSPSTWGEGGHLRVWLNEENEWIQPHLRVAEQRLTALVRRYPEPGELVDRALRQAARELVLAQASDWPFILHAGTSPEYAQRRVTGHLGRFQELYDMLMAGAVNEAGLREMEAGDNLFPNLDWRHWR